MTRSARAERASISACSSEQKVEQGLQAEILELVQGDDIALFGKLCDQLGKLAKAADTVVDASGLEVIVAGD